MSTIIYIYIYIFKWFYLLTDLVRMTKLNHFNKVEIKIRTNLKIKVKIKRMS